MERKENLVVEGLHNKPIYFDIIYNSTGKPKPVVIFSHGFKGFKDWGPFNLVADKFADAGFIFVKLNFAYNGITPDNFYFHGDLEAFAQNTFTKELDDLGVLIGWLEKNSELKEEMDFSELNLIGHSRGGGISILKAKEDLRVKKVAVWASALDFEKHINQNGTENWRRDGVVYALNARTQQQMPLYYTLYEDYYENKNRLDIKSALKKLQQPLIIFHGTDDDAVPFDDAVEMHSLNKGSVFVKFEKGNHTFGGVHPFDGNELPEDLNKVVLDTIDFF